VRQEVDLTNELPNRIVHVHGTLEVWATTRDDGTLIADVRFTGDGKGTGADSCESGGSAPYTLTLFYEPQQLAASGSRDGDRVTLSVRGQLRTTILKQGTGCDGAPASDREVEVEDFEAPVPIEGDLSNGQFEDEQTLQPDEETTVRVHTLIEEKSVPTSA
jgi:hypothetical protein